MDRIIVLSFVGAILAVSGCRGAMSQEDHRRALLETREAWGRAIAEGNIEGIFSFWTEDVVIYPVGEPAVSGIAAVREYVRRNRQDLGLTPRMTLVEAGASESGDLGYTIGTHEWVDREGNATMPGRYVTLWRKNDQGEWKCFLEIHSPRPTDGVIEREAQ
jgi:ketosteroid isomerase-like protein